MIYLTLNLHVPPGRDSACGGYIRGIGMAEIKQTKESLETARAALEGETKTVVQVSNRLNENLIKAIKSTWRQLLFIWAVLIALFISYFLVINKTPLATKVIIPFKDAGTGKPSGSLPLHSDPIDTIPSVQKEKEKLVEVLNQIREGQIKKDINLFLNAYSPSFIDFRKKRQQTLKIWEKYDYLELEFNMSDIKQQDFSTIFGQVTWNIKARDRKTNKIKNLSKSYKVHFSKESGKWLVQNLELLDTETSKK